MKPTAVLDLLYAIERREIGVRYVGRHYDRPRDIHGRVEYETSNGWGLAAFSRGYSWAYVEAVRCPGATQWFELWDTRFGDYIEMLADEWAPVRHYQPPNLIEVDVYQLGERQPLWITGLNFVLFGEVT